MFGVSCLLPAENFETDISHFSCVVVVDGLYLVTNLFTGVLSFYTSYLKLAI
jgi:hypothetical protein